MFSIILLETYTDDERCIIPKYPCMYGLLEKSNRLVTEKMFSERQDFTVLDLNLKSAVTVCPATNASSQPTGIN